MSQLTVDTNAVAPGTPAAGKVILYPKTDKLWYQKDDAGLETALGFTGALAVTRGGTGATTAGASGVPTVSALVDGATPALDASLGNVFTLTAAGDRTIAVPTNPTNGQKIIIRHLASGAGRTLALNSGAGGFRFGSDITALTQTASGKTDYIGCIYSSIDSKWDVVAVSKGY